MEIQRCNKSLPIFSTPSNDVGKTWTRLRDSLAIRIHSYLPHRIPGNSIDRSLFFILCNVMRLTTWCTPAHLHAKFARGSFERHTPELGRSDFEHKQQQPKAIYWNLPSIVNQMLLTLPKINLCATNAMYTYMYISANLNLLMVNRRLPANNKQKQPPSWAVSPTLRGASALERCARVCETCWLISTNVERLFLTAIGVDTVPMP